MISILAAVVLTVLATLVVLNLRAEKKIDVKPTHIYAVSDPQFLRSMGVLLGPPLAEGNRVETLLNGDRIFPSMLQAIASARQTISFETYIYWSGDIGKRFAEALAERSRAGVKVNVLVDWLGSQKMDNDSIEVMTQAGVDFRKYRPLRWYNLGRVNNRTHRKLLVVDGRVGFTGGVGIADNWTGDAQDPEHWRDNHYRIEGPAVAQMQAAFMDNWTKVSGVVLHGDQYFPPEKRVGAQYAQVFQSSSEGGSESMHLMYLLSIAAATKTIDLAMAYFVPDEVTSGALIDAMKRGVPRAADPAGRKHRCRIRSQRVARGLGPAFESGGADSRVPTHDVSREAADRRRPVVFGGLDQLRCPIVSLERRSQSERL